mgnify:CR=1 FL=1
MLNFMVTAPIMSIGGLIMAMREDAGLSWLVWVSVPVLMVIVGLLVTRLMPLFQRMQDNIDSINGVMREQIKAGAIMDLSTAVDANWKSRFSEAAVQAYTIDGKMWGVPMHTSQVGFFYNRDLFTKAGVDGVICVDVPPEEDAELGPALRSAGIHLVRLATPTTDAKRLPAVLEGASGFAFHVAGDFPGLELQFWAIRS